MSKGYVGNRRLWVNASIGKLQASLEVVRTENLVGRGEESIDMAVEELRGILDSFDEQMGYVPFTKQRKGNMGDE